MMTLSTQVVIIKKHDLGVLISDMEGKLKFFRNIYNNLQKEKRQTLTKVEFYM